MKAVSATVLLTGALAGWVGEPSPEVVQLRFDWPDATASVAYTSSVQRVDDGRTSSSQAQRNYRLTIARRDDGLRVTREAARPGVLHMQPVTADGRPLPQTGEVQALIDDLSEHVPGIVVSPAGEFVDVERPEAVIEEMGLALKRSHLPAAFQDRLRGLFDAAFVRALAADDWNSRVAMWRGRRLRLGEEFSARGVATPPSLPFRLDLTVTGRVARRLACDERDAARSCVELVSESRSDPAQAARALERLQGGGEIITSLRLERSLRIVARPESLLPAFVELRRSAEVRRKGAKGDKLLTETGTRAWSFTYDAATRPRAAP